MRYSGETLRPTFLFEQRPIDARGGTTPKPVEFFRGIPSDLFPDGMVKRIVGLSPGSITDLRLLDRFRNTRQQDGSPMVTDQTLSLFACVLFNKGLGISKIAKLLGKSDRITRDLAIDPIEDYEEYERFLEIPAIPTIPTLKKDRDQRDAEIVRLRNEGFGQKEISTATGVPSWTVSYVLSKEGLTGLEKRKGKPTDQS